MTISVTVYLFMYMLTIATDFRRIFLLIIVCDVVVVIVLSLSSIVLGFT